MEEQNLLRLVTLIAVAALVFPGFLYYMRRTNMSDIMRNVLIWVAIGLGAAVLYGLFR